MNGEWIPTSERLPKNGQRVIAWSGLVLIVTFIEGISQETREKMERGEIENPTEEVWCLADGTQKIPRSKLYQKGDEWNSNKVPYCWDDSPMTVYNGQDMIAWMPLPEPPHLEKK